MDFKKKMQVKKGNIILIFIIVFIGFLLRFYNFFNIPFSLDEHGVAFTSHFKDFNELLIIRIFIDGHPAGITIFQFIG